MMDIRMSLIILFTWTWFSSLYFVAVNLKIYDPHSSFDSMN